MSSALGPSGAAASGSSSGYRCLSLGRISIHQSHSRAQQQ
jgi:hypothetical protein